MNATTDPVAARLAHVDARLAALEYQLHRIGRPAANRLFERLEALKIEDRALRRNLGETCDGTVHHALDRLEALIRHIESEERSVEHEAAFLGQSAPSTVTLAAEAGARMAAVIGKGLHRVLHGHHPLGSSVFVNHTHDQLVESHGLREEPADPA